MCPHPPWSSFPICHKAQGFFFFFKTLSKNSPAQSDTNSVRSSLLCMVEPMNVTVVIGIRKDYVYVCPFVKGWIERDIGNIGCWLKRHYQSYLQRYWWLAVVFIFFLLVLVAEFWKAWLFEFFCPASLSAALIMPIRECFLRCLVNYIDLLQFPSPYSERLLDKVQPNSLEWAPWPRDARRRLWSKWVLNGYNWQWPLLAPCSPEPFHQDLLRREWMH